MKTLEIKLHESAYEYGYHWRVFHVVSDSKVVGSLQFRGEALKAMHLNACVADQRLSISITAQREVQKLERALRDLSDGLRVVQTLETALA